jgi:orotate phosphoribosyltransferase
MSSKNKHIAREMVNAGLVTINAKEIKLASGIKSPVYCDINQIQSMPRLREIIIKSLVEKISDYEDHLDGVVGTVPGMVPFSAIVAYSLNLPHYSIGEMQKKLYGKKYFISGQMIKGKNLLLLEDVVSAGRKSTNFIKELRKQGARVDKCLTIVSYETRIAQTNYKEVACSLDYLTTIDRVIYEYFITKQPAKQALRKLQGFVKKYFPQAKEIIRIVSHKLK